MIMGCPLVRSDLLYGGVPGALPRIPGQVPHRHGLRGFLRKKGNTKHRDPWLFKYVHSWSTDELCARSAVERKRQLDF